MQDATGLLPHIIGERVAMDRDLSEEDSNTFADFVEARALYLFNHNRKFRVSLIIKDQEKVLATMYMWANHWLDAVCSVSLDEWVRRRERNNENN